MQYGNIVNDIATNLSSSKELFSECEKSLLTGCVPKYSKMIVDMWSELYCISRNIDYICLENAVGDFKLAEFH